MLTFYLSYCPILLAQQWQDISPEVERIFPNATRMLAPTTLPVTEVYQLNQLIGYLFETNDLVNFPGFSGQPINLRVGLNTIGVIKGIEIISHNEPIFLHGLGEKVMLEFIAQYFNQQIKQRFLVGSTQTKINDGTTVYLDGISKATVSVMIINDTIINAATQVARAKLSGFQDQANSQLILNNFTPLTFTQLLQQQLIYRWQLSSQQAALLLDIPTNLLATQTQIAPSADFIDIYAAVLNPAMVGQNLLGQAEYQRLLDTLAEGEIALMLFSAGQYHFIADDFITGTSPTRFNLSQSGFAVDIRDIDFIVF